METGGDYETKDENKCVMKLYKRRWFVLLLLILILIMNQIPVFMYTVIANLVIKYYNVSALAVDWTSIVSMASNIPFSIPSAYVINRWGIRATVLIGAFGTSLGLFINAFASSRDLFWVIMTGQTVLAIAQVPLIIVIPRLVAVWFGSREITTATCIGSSLGVGFGSGLGFLLPPMFVTDHNNIGDIGRDLTKFQWALFGGVVPILLVILTYFPEKPPLPPSPTQIEELNREKGKQPTDFWVSVKELFGNRGFLLHLLASCINISIYASIGTFLNQIILNYFPNSETDVGRMGFCMTIFSIMGSLTFSYFLDRAKKFKELTIGVFILSFFGLLLYIFALESRSKLTLYIASGLVGLFSSAYGPVSFQFAIELTYPCPEGTTSGVLATASQVISIINTHALAILLDLWGTFNSLLSMAVLLFVGIILTFFIPNNLRRQAVFKRHKKQNYEIKFSSVPKEENKTTV